MLRFRPHRACLDGEEDGVLEGRKRQIIDPIQLAWMVKEIVWLLDLRSDLIHHPDKLDGAFARDFAGIVLALHLFHHPHKADGAK